MGVRGPKRTWGAETARRELPPRAASDRAAAGAPTAHQGFWYGLAGVASFSLTLPATRVAVGAFAPVTVGLGRALVAAVLAAAALRLARQPLPRGAQWRSLALVAAGVILGFPLLSAWAMQRVPATHGAIVLGLLPLATAGAAALRAGERPSRSFWLAAAAGSAVVLAFALGTGAGRLQAEDLALLGAVAAAALGYAEGGRLARDLGGWQVIAWALVIAAPVLALPVAVAVWRTGMSGPPQAWLAFGYVAAVSQFAGFVAWYKGLALGGVARVGQLQLLQPFLTILASGLLLDEPVTPGTFAAALLVVATVALGRRAPIARAP